MTVDLCVCTPAKSTPATEELLPLREAPRLPRVNLLIADDVGLGKTVEAGLVARELLLRRRIDLIVITAPPATTIQWKDEFEAYRLVGVYTGKILRGALPAELPVEQASKVDLVINLKATKAFQVSVPTMVMGRADEVIE